MGSPRCMARGRTRTGDTPVFSRVLYQLSYLAAARQSSRVHPPPSGAAAGADRRAGVRHVHTRLEEAALEPGTLLLIVGAVLVGAVAAARAATRLGVPVLLGFLALGMLLGSDGPGGIEFDDPHLARTLGVIGPRDHPLRGRADHAVARRPAGAAPGGAAQHRRGAGLRAGHERGRVLALRPLVRDRR